MSDFGRPPTAWRHRRRGSDYSRLRDDVIAQCEVPIQDGDKLTLYQSPDGKMAFVRPPAEFDDGRFVQLQPDYYLGAAVKSGASDHMAQMLDLLKNELLICFLRRLGGKVVIPVQEVDATRGVAMTFDIVNGQFIFGLAKATPEQTAEARRKAGLRP